MGSTMHKFCYIYWCPLSLISLHLSLYSYHHLSLVEPPSHFVSLSPPYLVQFPSHLSTSLKNDRVLNQLEKNRKLK